MKKELILGVIAVALLATVGAVMAAPNTCTLANGDLVARGFDEFGYNRCAHQFVGTGESWAMGKLGMTHVEAEAYMEPYAHDKLVMKWNEEWDRGNAEGWNDPNGYDAWENNEWNGMCDGCSGEVWHYKIKWVESCGTVGIASTVPGGYCIWGQFWVLMDQGTSGGEHIWLAHEIPT
ncbi:MAG TPA: hypothetical protein VJ343_01370, partial [archaeon]|nr:hypothetical protein [archaeon]